MRTSKLIWALTASVAVLVVAVATSTASEGLEFEPTTTRATTGALTFSSPEAEAPVTCPVTLSTTLHATAAKTGGSLAGYVTATYNEAGCRGGRARTLGERWHLQYVSFSGTLPNITQLRLRISDWAWLINGFGGFAQCLYRGAAELTTTQTGTTITGLSMDESVEILLSRRLFGACPQTGVFRGEFTLAPSVRMTLVGEEASRCATPPAVRVDEGFQRQEGANATIGMTAQVECESTRIDSIRMARANESIGIEDRERAVGRTFRRGERFRYDLRLTAREGTRVVEENVEISWTEEGGSSRGTTRVRFTDL